MTRANRSPLYSLSTHDFPKAGYDVCVRADETIRIESVCHWQGSRSGVVWIARAPEALMASARGEEQDDEAPDTETLVRDWLETDWQSEARRIRVGGVVR